MNPSIINTKKYAAKILHSGFTFDIGTNFYRGHGKCTNTYFNCITGASNYSGSFLLENAEACYDKVFKGEAYNDEFSRIIK